MFVTKAPISHREGLSRSRSFPETQLIDALIAFGRVEKTGRVCTISLDLLSHTHAEYRSGYQIYRGE